MLALHFHTDLSMSAPLTHPHFSKRFMAARNLGGSFPKDANPKVYQQDKDSKEGRELGMGLAEPALVHRRHPCVNLPRDSGGKPTLCPPYIGKIAWIALHR